MTATETRAEARARIESPDNLRRILSYCPDTGVLTWRILWPGRIAGTVTADGYLRVALEGLNFKAHRIAMVMATGLPLPRGAHIDHLNGDKLDNRAANLRVCTPKANQENAKRPRNNTTGFKGVARCGGRYRAYICHQRRQHHLGVHDTPEAAHAAYCAAAEALGWEVHRPN